MSRYKLFLPFIFYLLTSTFLPLNATVYKVTSMVNVHNQNELTGYNFVTEFCALVYSELQNGHFQMWDTYKKENKLDFNAINRLEKSSGTSFLHSQNLFLYEYWNVRRYKTKIYTKGFVFTAKGKENNDVSFGYLEYEDVKQYLSTLMRTNSNGPMKISFEEALHTKKYNFNLIQVNNEIISEKERSEYIVNNAFKGKYSPKVQTDGRRLILYKIVNQTLPGEKQPVSCMMLNQIAKYLRADSAILLTYMDTLKTNSQLIKNFRISELIVAESINNNKNYITNEPLSLIINYDGIYSTAIDFNTFRKWGIMVNLRQSSEILKEKNFEYTLFRINSQDIRPEDSPFYISAIKTLKWNEMTNTVRNLKEKKKSVQNEK